MDIVDFKQFAPMVIPSLNYEDILREYYERSMPLAFSQNTPFYKLSYASKKNIWDTQGFQREYNLIKLYTRNHFLENFNSN